MRIIAGRFKGRRLPAAPRGVRPSTDRVRERLFMILGGELPGGLAVDLFCGAGTLGIEALSRGAECCLFVDHSRDHLAALGRCLAALGLGEDEYRLRCADAPRFVTQEWPEEKVDWVFLDPPYGDPAGAACLSALGRLDPERLGTVVFEGPPLALAAPGHLRVDRTLDFGDTRITLLRGGTRR